MCPFLRVGITKRGMRGCVVLAKERSRRIGEQCSDQPGGHGTDHQGYVGIVQPGVAEGAESRSSGVLRFGTKARPFCGC